MRSLRFYVEHTTDYSSPPTGRIFAAPPVIGKMAMRQTHYERLVECWVLTAEGLQGRENVRVGTLSARCSQTSDRIVRRKMRAAYDALNAALPPADGGTAHVQG